MTTLFYTGTDPIDSRMGLAHYCESLAAHSFFRVQLAHKKAGQPTFTILHTNFLWCKSYDTMFG